MTTAPEGPAPPPWQRVDAARRELAASTTTARDERLAALLASDPGVALALSEDFPSPGVARALVTAHPRLAGRLADADPIAPWAPLAPRFDRALAASLDAAVPDAVELAWRRAEDASVDPALLVALARVAPERARPAAAAWVERRPDALAPLLRYAATDARAAEALGPLLPVAEQRALAPRGALALMEPLARLHPAWLEANANVIADRSPEALPVLLGALQRAGRPVEAVVMALAKEALLDRHLFIQEASYCIRDYDLKRRAEQANERAKRRTKASAKHEGYAAARELLWRHVEEAARLAKVEPEAVTHLWLNEVGPLKSWEPLKELPALRSLSVYRGKVPDLGALAALPALEELSLGEKSAVASLAPLRGSATLRSLTAPGGVVASLGAAFPALTRLHVGRPTAEDLDAVGRFFPSLEALSLVKAPAVSDLAFLRGLAGLKYLYVVEASLASLAGLPCAALEALTVSGAPALADVTALGAATRLAHLALTKVAAGDLGAVAKGSSLTHVQLGEAPVASLDFLANHGGLETLNAYKATALADVGALRGRRSLKHLNLEKTRVKDLSPLAGCDALEELYLGGLKGARDFGFLASLTALKRVDLHDTRFDDVTLLAALPSLTHARLKGTAVSEDSPAAVALRDALFARGGRLSFAWGW